jgi:hypothetical protein
MRNRSVLLVEFVEHWPKNSRNVSRDVETFSVYMLDAGIIL